MTILITGALTSLGRALTNRLVAEGRDVRLLVRRPFSAAEIFGQVQYHEWHPVSEPLPTGVLDGVTSIVHLIGEPFDGRLTGPQRDRLSLLRRVALEKIVSNISCGEPRLVLASTVGIHGDQPGSAVSCTDAPGEPRTPLQAAAHEWESTVRTQPAIARQAVIARFGLIVGADKMLEELAEWIALGVAPSVGQAIVPLIDLDDAVALLVGLIDNPSITGPINAVSPHAVASADLIAAICKTLGVKPRIHLPARTCARLLGAGSSLLLRQSQVVPQRLIELGCTFSQPDPLVGIRSKAAAMKRRRIERPSAWERLRCLYGFSSPGRIAAGSVSDQTDAAHQAND